MDVAEPESRAQRFFDEFVEAFETFDGARLAERYASPYLAFHANGRSDVFSSNQDIAKYFQRVLDESMRRACAAARTRIWQSFELATRAPLRLLPGNCTLRMAMCFSLGESRTTFGFEATSAWYLLQPITSNELRQAGVMTCTSQQDHPRDEDAAPDGRR